MRNKGTIFDYVGLVFKVFGFSILCLNLFCLLFGETAKEISTIFAFGSAGLGLKTMLEFFLISVITVGLQILFFTDMLIKKMPLAVRTVCMFTLEIAVLAAFIVVCGWFPVKMWQPWVMFFLCFGISAGVSVAVSGLKEKSENRKMQEALRRLKEGENP